MNEPVNVVRIAATGLCHRLAPASSAADDLSRALDHVRGRQATGGRPLREVGDKMNSAIDRRAEHHGALPQL